MDIRQFGGTFFCPVLQGVNRHAGDAFFRHCFFAPYILLFFSFGYFACQFPYLAEFFFFLVQLLLQGVLLQFFLLLVEFVIASVTHKCVPAQFTGFGKPVEQSAVVTDNDQGGTAVPDQPGRPASFLHRSVCAWIRKGICFRVPSR